MLKAVAGGLLVMTATPVWAGSQPTNFGVRTLSGAATSNEAASNEAAPASDPVAAPMTGRRVNLAAAANVASKWGRVTSTWRSPEHNRRVGGVRNSFHLSGRAIDIARRPGVSHAQIVAAFRNAGYQLVESLDEGDHSHFAFGSGRSVFGSGQTVFRTARLEQRRPATQWRMVSVASASFK